MVKIEIGEWFNRLTKIIKVTILPLSKKHTSQPNPTAHTITGNNQSHPNPFAAPEFL